MVAAGTGAGADVAAFTTGGGLTVLFTTGGGLTVLFTTGTTTVNVTVFVEHVAAVQLGVCSLVKLATFEMTWPFVSAEATSTPKLTVAVPGVVPDSAATSTPLHVTTPPCSDTEQTVVGTSPQLAEPAT